MSSELSGVVGDSTPGEFVSRSGFINPPPPIHYSEMAQYSPRIQYALDLPSADQMPIGRVANRSRTLIYNVTQNPRRDHYPHYHKNHLLFAAM